MGAQRAGPERWVDVNRTVRQPHGVRTDAAGRPCGRAPFPGRRPHAAPSGALSAPVVPPG